MHAPDLNANDRIYFKDNGDVLTYLGTNDGKYFSFTNSAGERLLKTEPEVNHILNACRIKIYDAQGHNREKE